jgi:hypothetical protein
MGPGNRANPKAADAGCQSPARDTGSISGSLFLPRCAATDTPSFPTSHSYVTDDTESGLMSDDNARSRGSFHRKRVGPVAITAPKDRLLASSAIALIAAAILLCWVGGVRPSLEVVLNLLWLGLASATLAAWLCRCTPVRRSRRLELLALLFAFALLFPVISPSDDLAQPLDDDACTAQMVLSVLKAERHFPATVGLPEAALRPLPFLPTLVWSTEITAGHPAKLLPSAISHATGNHSPPLT